MSDSLIYDAVQKLAVEVSTLKTRLNRVEVIENRPSTLAAASGSPMALTAGSAGDLTANNTVRIPALVFPDGGELTISAGSTITVTHSYHTVNTNASAATGNLITISGGSTGMWLLLKARYGARTVTLKDNVDNLRLGGDRALDDDKDTILLFYDNAATWCEAGFGNNA